MFDALISGHVSMTLDRFSFAPSKENKFRLLTMQGQKKKKKSRDSKATIDSAVAPPPTFLTSNAIYFLLAFVSTRASLSPDLTKARH